MTSHEASATADKATPSELPPAGSVAVLGLGPMGRPMARNLLASGMKTTVWNRTRSTADPLAADGARVAESVADAAADVVISVLPDVPQLRSLLDDETLVAFEEAGTVLVVTSTTSPEHIQSLGADLGARHISVLDAPMSGGVAGAAAGTLSMM